MNDITLILLLLPDLLSGPICSSLHAVYDSISSSLLMCCDSLAFCVATACVPVLYQSQRLRACVPVWAHVPVCAHVRPSMCL